MRRETLALGLLASIGMLFAACATGLIQNEPDSSAADATTDVGADQNHADVIIPGDAGCPQGLTVCGQVCVDTKKDPSHCGGCSNACSTAEAGTPDDGGSITATCTNGQCGVTCSGDLSPCNGQCTNEKNDPNNCGGCAIVCDASNCCTGTCTDTTTDDINCGTCGHSCDAGLSCVTSVCSNTPPYKVGNYTAFTGTGSFTQNYLLGEKFTLSKAAKLLDFGIIYKTSGQHVVMALYTDKANAPDQLVAYTASTALTNSDQQIPPNTSASLAATSYWIMAVYDLTAGPGEDTSSSTQYDYISFTYGGTLPQTFGTAQVYAAGQNFNYYLVVQ